MQEIAHATYLIDLEHGGLENVIAACLLHTGNGFYVVDPGPTSTLETLRRKLAATQIRIRDLAGLLLTHIHLDHSGATGSLLRENPDLRIFVHAKGASHLVDPSRLLSSARRLYEADLERLWGPVLPVPADRITPLDGGETFTFGRRRIEVLYTPGHAYHHVTYFDHHNSIAFVGDTAGVRMNPSLILPVTPPPDVDLEAWNRSLDRVLHKRPGRLFLTHFGPAEPVEEHVADLRRELKRWGQRVLASLRCEGTDQERAERFAEEIIEEMKTRLIPSEVERYWRSGGLELSWLGLARYWRKKGTAAQTS